MKITGFSFSTTINTDWGGSKQRELKDWDMTPQPPIPLLADVKRNENIPFQSFDSDFYYNALDGIIFNDGTKLSKNDFQLSFDDDATANARYLGFKNNKYLINFSIGDFEITADNIRATAIHGSCSKWHLLIFSHFN